ncbi:MAG: hypothetical protein HUU20_13610 [Pirellulales bacterium]|nr:hypothetical protein [Pirellulales bacterium]
MNRHRFILLSILSLYAAMPAGEQVAEGQGTATTSSGTRPRSGTSGSSNHSRARSRQNIHDAFRKLFLCLPLACCAASRAAEPSIASGAAADIQALRAGFHTPPCQAGPWVYWMFFENVMSKTEITRELKEMAAAGIAGAEMRFLSMHGFSGRPGPWFDSEGWKRLDQKPLEFLSAEFVEMLAHACAEAQRLDLRLAINLGMGWPPGGPWITDEHRSKHLVARAEVVQGERALRGDAAMAVPARAMVFAWRLRDAAPDGGEVVGDSFRDLGGSVGPRNRLEWDVPEGRWLIGIFQEVPGGVCDKGNGPEVDPGSRAAVLFHLDHLFGRLQPRLQDYFGTTLVEVASDSWEYERRGGARYWSPDLLARFPAVAGYDLRQRLHVLLGYGPDCERTLADLERVERETIRDNFFATTTAYLHARKLRHRPQVRGRGMSRDLFEACAESDVPEVEEEVSLPEAVWTARTLGKRITSAEAFTFLSGHGRNLDRDGQQKPHHGPLADPQRQWETNLAMLRWHAGAHFARGINRIQMHSFGYSPLGLPPPGWRIYAEVHLNRHVPWWPYMKSFTTWLARTQWVLQSGEPVADALVYPVRSNPPEGPYHQSPDQPVSALNAIDAASPYTLERLRRAGESRYDCSRLVLIGDVSRPDEARRILELVEGGTLLVCCRTMPDDWPALRGSSDAAPLQEAFRTAIRRGKVIDARTQGWQTALDDGQSVRWIPASANLSFQHRRVQGGEVYFVTNWGGKFLGDVSFPHADLVPEIWDADAGTSLRAGQYRTDQGRTAVRLSLDSHESALVVFTRSAPALHAVGCDRGHVAYGPDGRLCVRPDGPGLCRVELSDGRTREIHLELPELTALDGPWTLSATPSQGVGLPSAVDIELPKLVSWREIPSLRTYAGIAAYGTEFDLPPDRLREGIGLVLELGEVYELADVWLNGRRIGTSWFPPHHIELTGHVRPGKNTLRIDVPNILKNHLEQGNYARPSGLLGPVRIRPAGQVILKDNAP